MNFFRNIFKRLLQYLFKGLFKKKQISVQHELLQEFKKKEEKPKNDCKHTDFKVVFYSFRPGSRHAARLCKECGEYLSGASQEEAQKLWIEQGNKS